MRFKDYYHLQERTIGKTYQYSSTQYDLPFDLSKEIFDWGSKFIPDAVLDPEDGRQAENDLHLTLLYGLTSSEKEVVEPVISLLKPFVITLGVVSMFNSETKDVVKITVEKSPELVRYHNFLKNNLKNEYKFPDYQPHITIAFVAPGSCNRLLGADVFAGKELIVDCIQFSSTKGYKIPIQLG